LAVNDHLVLVNSEEYSFNYNNDYVVLWGFTNL